MALNILMLLAGLIVLAEGVNKLERTDVAAHGLNSRQRATVMLKAAGWFCLVLGAGGSAFCALLPLEYVRLGYALTVIGFALLVVRSRVRETAPGQRPIGSDEFERTQMIDRRRP